MKVRVVEATFRSSPSHNKEHLSPNCDKCIQSFQFWMETLVIYSSFHQLTNHRFIFHRWIKVKDDNTHVLHKAEKGDAIMSFLKPFRSTPQTCFRPVTPPPDSRFSTSATLSLFFSNFLWLMSDYFAHICLSLMISAKLSLSRGVPFLLQSVAMKL